MLAILILIFAGDVADLGHPDFRRREAATQRLVRFAPLSLPAIRSARPTDPEARMRLELVERRVSARWNRRTELPFRAARDLTARGDATEDEDAAFWATPARFRVLFSVAVAMGLATAEEAWMLEQNYLVAPGPKYAAMGHLRIARGRANGAELKWDPMPGPWPKQMPAVKQ